MVFRKEKLRPHLFCTTRRHPTIPSDLVPLFRGFALRRVRFPWTRCRFLDFCCASFLPWCFAFHPRDDNLYIKHSLYPSRWTCSLLLRMYKRTCLRTYMQFKIISAHNIYTSCLAKWTFQKVGAVGALLICDALRCILTVKKTWPLPSRGDDETAKMSRHFRHFNAVRLLSSDKNNFVRGTRTPRRDVSKRVNYFIGLYLFPTLLTYCN